MALSRYINMCVRVYMYIYSTWMSVSMFIFTTPYWSASVILSCTYIHSHVSTSVVDLAHSPQLWVCVCVISVHPRRHTLLSRLLHQTRLVLQKHTHHRPSHTYMDTSRSIGTSTHLVWLAKEMLICILCCKRNVHLYVLLQKTCWFVCSAAKRDLLIKSKVYRRHTDISASTSYICIIQTLHHTNTCKMARFAAYIDT